MEVHMSFCTVRRRICDEGSADALRLQSKEEAHKYLREVLNFSDRSITAGIWMRCMSV